MDDRTEHLAPRCAGGEVTDNLADTGDLGHDYCPTCEPERDAFTDILRVRYCEPHALDVSGSADHLTGPIIYMSGSNEVEGADCRAMAELLRRR